MANTPDDNLLQALSTARRFGRPRRAQPMHTATQSTRAGIAPPRLPRTTLSGLDRAIIRSFTDLGGL